MENLTSGQIYVYFTGTWKKQPVLRALAASLPLKKEELNHE